MRDSATETIIAIYKQPLRTIASNQMHIIARRIMKKNCFCQSNKPQSSF